MRSRNIKPGFFSNEFLIELGWGHSILFAGLWSLADRRGVLEDRPGQIRAKLPILCGNRPFSMTIQDVDKALNDLQRPPNRFIKRFTSQGQRCIKILNFWKHQNPHIKEKSTDLPDYQPVACKPGASPVLDVYTPDTIPVQASLIPDSPSLIPDSGIPIQSTSPAPVFVFDEIWRAYPNKDGRKEAERHFKASVQTPQDWADIQKALKNYTQHLRNETWKKPKNGSTWFNNWRDWINWQDPNKALTAPKVLAPKPPLDPEEIRWNNLTPEERAAELKAVRDEAAAAHR